MARSGSTRARGYSGAHQRIRRAWAPIVASGTARCTRCKELIAPDARWHLDHRDDRTGWEGAAHKQCNESAGGRKGRAKQLAQQNSPQPKRVSNW